MTIRSAFEVTFALLYPETEVEDIDDEVEDDEDDTDVVTVTVFSDEVLSLAEFAVQLEENKMKIAAEFGYDDEGIEVDIDKIENVSYQHFAQLPKATKPESETPGSKL
jgi:biopolymer transport protein ExbD